MKTSRFIVRGENNEKITQISTALGLSITLVSGVYAANHREAPITALDHKADITDVYAFVSYDNPDKVTLIMNIDPLLEPSNGPRHDFRLIRKSVIASRLITIMMR